MSRCGMLLARAYSLSAPITQAAMKPIMNMIEPMNPNMCMGLRPKSPRNHKVIRSRYPFMKRFSPNFDVQYLRA